jgi:starvation-inducible DNA-binding protein
METLTLQRDDALVTRKGAEMTTNFHIPLAPEQRSVAVELQAMLVDLLDLTLIGKHAHWNVEGPHFRSVHLELDELVDTWQRLSDDVAERAVTIGASPDGQAETIAGATQFEALPAGHLSDRHVLETIGDRLAEAAARARQRIDRVDVVDPVTGDLLIDVAGTLEKQLWMIRAQTVGPERASEIAAGERAADVNGVDRS